MEHQGTGAHPWVASTQSEMALGGTATCVHGAQRCSSDDGQLQRRRGRKKGRIGAVCRGGGVAALGWDREGMEAGNNNRSSSYQRPLYC